MLFFTLNANIIVLNKSSLNKKYKAAWELNSNGEIMDDQINCADQFLI